MRPLRLRRLWSRCLSVRKTERNILRSLLSLVQGIVGVKHLILQVLPVLLATDLALAEQGRTLYSLEEVSEFFLANNPNKTEEYFDEMLEKESFEMLARNDCFSTYWEYRLASSKGHSSSFSHALCRDRSVSRNAYQRWYKSYKQALTESNTASDGTSSSSPSWMTSFGGKPYAEQKTNTSSVSSTDSIDEVAAFFLSSSRLQQKTRIGLWRRTHASCPFGNLLLPAQRGSRLHLITTIAKPWLSLEWLAIPVFPVLGERGAKAPTTHPAYNFL